jgi:DNA helicase-2/ATP-dependent DNA helicase PcrA
MANDNYLSLLNPEQRRAVETTDGPVLVLSGAGTGKTRVITERIAHILRIGLARPWEVLALTFTNKAANEMKRRVIDSATPHSTLHTPHLNDIWLGTFHSIGLRILRYNAVAAGLERDFIVLGEDGQKSVLKTVITALGLDTKEYPPADWVEKIQAIKDKGLRVIPEFLRAAQKCLEPGKAQGVEKLSNSDKIYNAYNAELARLNAVDFGDLILKVLQLFVSHPDILKKYQQQFKYVMVDEYQDTNASQHQLLRMLAAGHNNICCVGDDDQSIYSWRGADIKNILGFEQDYAGATVIRLETNYRSTGNILGAANSLIRHNRSRLGKDLRTAPDAGDGEKVRIIPLPTDFDETRLIADAVEHETGAIALLIRTNSLSDIFEKEFVRRNIPYIVIGGTKLYDRAEIRDLVAYASLLAYPHDDISFARIISKPRRGFGEVALQKIRDFATAKNISMFHALREIPLSGKQAGGAKEFLSAFDFNWAGQDPMAAIAQLLDRVGYMKMWQESKDPDAKERLQRTIDFLTNEEIKYETIAEFLEDAILKISAIDDDETSHSTLHAPHSQRESVAIMTIHAAKGLEFDTVFLPAWEDGIFPNEMAIQDGGLEEERRLAYVAITRAKRRAVITHVASRMTFGQRQFNTPSRFIDEIDEAFTCHPGNAAQRRYPGSGKDISKPNQIPGSALRPRNDTMVGKLVSHPDLGSGVVIEENDGDIFTIAFKDKGIKKVARKFVS